ncbi:MAG: hypothetical protein AB8B84_11400 [Granulosicoccus sp.]
MLQFGHRVDTGLGSNYVDGGGIAAVDFVEIMPEVDIDGISGLTVSRLVAATMGLIVRQQASH